MESTTHRHREDRPLSTIARDLLNGLSGLIRSEMKLARVEMTHNAKLVGKSLAASAVFAFVCVLGAFSLVAFMIIGLGVLLDERYWLSSLIVTVLLLVPGVIGLMKSIQALGKDASFDNTRYNLKFDQQLVTQRIQDLKSAPNIRASA